MSAAQQGDSDPAVVVCTSLRLLGFLDRPRLAQGAGAGSRAPPLPLSPALFGNLDSARQPAAQGIHREAIHFVLCRLNPRIGTERFRGCFPVLDHGQEREFMKISFSELHLLEQQKLFPHGFFKRYCFEPSRIALTLLHLTNLLLDLELVALETHGAKSKPGRVAPGVLGNSADQLAGLASLDPLVMQALIAVEAESFVQECAAAKEEEAAKANLIAEGERALALVQNDVEVLEEEVAELVRQRGTLEETVPFEEITATHGDVMRMTKSLNELIESRRIFKVADFKYNLKKNAASLLMDRKKRDNAFLDELGIPLNQPGLGVASILESKAPKLDQIRSSAETLSFELRSLLDDMRQSSIQESRTKPEYVAPDIFRDVSYQPRDDYLAWRQVFNWTKEIYRNPDAATKSMHSSDLPKGEKTPVEAAENAHPSLPASSTPEVSRRLFESLDDSAAKRRSEQIVRWNVFQLI
mmetsp:Transcript_3068/g.7962  ORF Transcript_3068/g.7962 Transcript_3068/m.7962 type:complete len:469 (-) Transcript_3068:71-1477(-)